ncbi:MAG: transposase [Ignavibacteriales bacterium]
MPSRKWTGEEKANIVLEILTTSTSTAEVCRRYNVRPTLVYSWRASSFKQVQEVYLVHMHRIEKSSWNRRIRDSRKW